MSTADLRNESGVSDRKAFTKAVDELQAAMIVMPSVSLLSTEIHLYLELAVARFPDGLRRRVDRETALREIARGFLDAAGMTIPGELARVTGLSRPDAGRGNRALVAEGYATMLAPGLYQLAHRPHWRSEVNEHRPIWCKGRRRERRPTPIAQRDYRRRPR